MTKEEIMNARNGAKPLGQFARQDRKEAIDGVLKGIYAMMGFIAEPQEVEEIVTGILDRISTRFQHLTVGELVLAWEAGVSGEYGKERRICIANLLSWLSSYVESDVRKDALTQIIKTQRTEARMLSQGDIEARNREACLRMARTQWQHYKATGSLEASLLAGTAAAICDYLVSAGKLRASDATQAEAISRAKEQRKLRGIPESLGRIGTQGELDSMAKRELLAMYYGSLVARGVELTV